MKAQNIRSSLVVIFSQSSFLLGLQFITTIFISRLLTPNEIGIFSVSAVLITLAATLRDFGVVDYISQEKELDERRLRAAIFVSFMVSWSVATIIALIAPIAANFYAVPEIKHLMYLLSFNFVLLPFGSVAMAYMRREGQFNRLAIIRATSGAIGSFFTILLAWQGFSFYSMAIAGIIAAIFSQILIQLWWPSSVPRLASWKGVKSVLAFGSYSSFGSIIKDIDKGAPDIILGRLIDMSAVAYFGRATGLIGMFNSLVVQVVNFVALPFFARKAREENIHQSKLFLQSAPLITGIAWPFFAFLGIYSWLVIPALFGEQWDQSIPLLFWLCIGEIFLVPFYLQGTVFIAQGLVKAEALRVLLMGIVKLVPLLLLPSMGLEMVAIGYAVSCFAAALISTLMLTNLLRITVNEIVPTLLHSLGVLFLSGTLMAATSHILKSSTFSMPTSLLLAIIATAVYWIVCTLLFHPILRKELLHISATLTRWITIQCKRPD